MLFVLAAYGLKAQSNVLKIQMLDDEVIWTSDKLHNIYFDGDETLIVVERESLFTHSYAIEGIKKIYFDTLFKIFVYSINILFTVSSSCEHN